MPQRLTTTSFAILGMVAEHGSTAHDLARRMEINLAYFWPGARSHVFTEVRKLVAHGLVAAEASLAGKRRATRYAITEQGRASLAAWMASPSQTFALQMEGLVRLFLAPHGSRDDLLAALGQMQEQGEDMLTLAARLIPAYVEGAGPYPQHVHLRALMIDFLTHFAELTRDWAKRSVQTVEGWSDLSREGKVDAACRLLQTLPMTRPDQ